MEENWKVYINGEIVPPKESKISVFDRGSQSGDGVFEGLRCYYEKIFRLEEHVIRFFDSAKAIHIRIPISHGEMKKAIKDTVRVNGFRTPISNPL